MKLSPIKLAIIVPTIIILIAAIILTITITTMNSASNLQYYDIAGEHVASINHVVGKRKVSSVSSKVSNSVLYKQYSYYGMESAIDDIQKYINYLCENDSFIKYEEFDPSIVAGQISLGKKSSQTGKDILLNIKYEIGRYMISIEKVAN